LLAGYLKKRKQSRYQGDFIFRLGDMLKQGFAISEALEFLLMNYNENDRQAIKMIHQELNSGSPLNEILRKLHFPSMVCLQVFFAEKHGKLPETLLSAGVQWKKNEQMKEKITKLIQYPAFLLVMLILLLFLLNLFLIPRFERLYTAMGFEPSPGTKVLMFFLQSAPPVIFTLMILLIIFLISFYQYYSRQNPRKRTKLLMKIPGFLSFFRLYFTQLFSREIGQLLRSGFAVNETLSILQQQTMQPMLEYVSNEINQQLKLGYALADAIEQVPLFEQQLARLIRHGEANGRLAEELIIFSEFCSSLMEERIRRILSVFQPAIFLFVGLVVVAIYLSVMLPMFQMVESI